MASFQKTYYLTYFVFLPSCGLSLLSYYLVRSQTVLLIFYCWDKTSEPKGSKGKEFILCNGSGLSGGKGMAWQQGWEAGCSHFHSLILRLPKLPQGPHIAATVGPSVPTPQPMGKTSHSNHHTDLLASMSAQKQTTSSCGLFSGTQLIKKRVLCPGVSSPLPSLCIRQDKCMVLLSAGLCVP